MWRIKHVGKKKYKKEKKYDYSNALEQVMSDNNNEEYIVKIRKANRLVKFFDFYLRRFTFGACFGLFDLKDKNEYYFEKYCSKAVLNDLKLQCKEVSQAEFDDSLNEIYEHYEPSLYDDVFKFFLWLYKILNLSELNLLFIHLSYTLKRKKYTLNINILLKQLSDKYTEYPGKKLRQIFINVIDLFSKKNLLKLDQNIVDLGCKLIESIFHSNLIPRILILDYIHKDTYKTLKVKNSVEQISQQLTPLKLMISVYQRSSVTFVYGINNVRDNFWALDCDTFLFSKPIFSINFHNKNSHEPEIKYVTKLILNTLKIDFIYGIFGNHRNIKCTGEHLIKCIINCLSELFFQVKEIGSLLSIKILNNNIRQMCYLISCSIYRDFFDGKDFIIHFMEYLKNNSHEIYITKIGIYILGDVLSMSRTEFGKDTLKLVINYLEEIFEKLQNEEVSLSQQTLITIICDTWVRVVIKCKDDKCAYCINKNSKLNQAVNLLQQKYVYLPKKFNFYSVRFLNINVCKSNTKDGYYRDLFLLLHDDKCNKYIIMPRGFKVPISKKSYQVKFKFLANLTFFTLTHFCNTLASHLMEEHAFNECYIMSPTMYDLLYECTLGKLGTYLRFQYVLVSQIDKMINFRIYNQIKGWLELLIFKPFPNYDIFYAETYVRISVMFEHVFHPKPELLYFFGLLTISSLSRTSKFDQSYLSTFIPFLKVNNLIFSSPDVNIYYIYNMICACMINGYNQNDIIILENYSKKAKNEIPHYWGEKILKKFPIEISNIYNDNKEIFNLREFLNDMSSLNEVLVKNSNEMNIVLIDDINLQKYLLIFLFSNLLNNLCPNKIILLSIRKMKKSHILSSLTNLIFFIVNVKQYNQSNGGSVIFQNVIDKLLLMSKLGLYTIDQLILSLFLYNHNDLCGNIVLDILFEILTNDKIFNMLTMHIKIKKRVESNSLKSHIKWLTIFHSLFPEYFEMDAFDYYFKLNTQSQPVKLLPIYYGNQVERIIYLVELIIHKILISSEPLYYFDKFKPYLTIICPHHPCVIRSLASILFIFFDEFVEAPEIKHDLFYIYLGSRFDIIEDPNIFSEQFFTCDLKNITTEINCPSYIEKIILKIACAINLPYYKYTTLIGDTHIEFNQKHVEQILICSSIEIMILIEEVLFANTLISMFLNPESGIFKKRHYYYSCSLTHCYQAFATLLSVLPYSYINESLSVISKSLSYISNDYSSYDKITFIKLLQDDDNVILYETDSSIFLLLRNYLQYIPINHLIKLPLILSTIFLNSIETEFEYVLICTSVVPCLERISHLNEMRSICIQICQMFILTLQNLSITIQKFNFIDIITDFFFILKYKYIGEEIKSFFVGKSINEDINNRLIFI